MLICNDHRISLANIARNSAPAEADFRTKLEANGQKRIPDLVADNEEEF
jgi:hypothetical protein